ncbi:MAG: hypothetical protein GY801_15185 [bacterium]|nr:hypothetical protein [bacterium]
MQTSTLENITQQVKYLTIFEQIELIEILAHHLKHNQLTAQPEFDWQALYGLGKGIWGDEDAQDYVNRLREERI